MHGGVPSGADYYHVIVSLGDQRTNAKSILMSTRGLSEEDAYKIIRDQAMSERVTAEEIADAVINANEILGLDLKS